MSCPASNLVCLTTEDIRRQLYKRIFLVTRYMYTVCPKKTTLFEMLIPFVNFCRKIMKQVSFKRKMPNFFYLMSINYYSNTPPLASMHFLTREINCLVPRCSRSSEIDNRNSRMICLTCSVLPAGVR